MILRWFWSLKEWKNRGVELGVRGYILHVENTFFQMATIGIAHSVSRMSPTLAFLEAGLTMTA